MVDFVVKKLSRGRPKKNIKYTKTINVRFTHEQWLGIQVVAHQCHLEPSVFIRKTILEQFDSGSEKTPEMPLRAQNIGMARPAKIAISRAKKTNDRHGRGQLHFDL